LATITSDDDAQIIFDLYKSGTNVWVGLSETDGVWSWASGYPCENDDCSTLKYWVSGEPNGHDGGEWCAWNGWVHTAINNMLDDYGCHVDLKVACDLPVPIADRHLVVRGKEGAPAFGDSHPVFECLDNDSTEPTLDTARGWGLAVRCCSMDGTTGYSPDCQSHGANGATFDEAEQLCSDHGYRLCTLDEALSGVPVGTGCNYNLVYHWLSDSCSGNVEHSNSAKVSAMFEEDGISEQFQSVNQEGALISGVLAKTGQGVGVEGRNKLGQYYVVHITPMMLVWSVLAITTVVALCVVLQICTRKKAKYVKVNFDSTTDDEDA